MTSESETAAHPGPPTLDGLRADIAAVLGVPAERLPGDDLIAMGLDSLRVMRLAGRWRAGGIEVQFAELMERPSLAQWHELLAERHGPPTVTPAPVDVRDDEPFDLATMQYAYWVGRNETLVLGGVATHFYAEFDGAAVDPARLGAAVRALAGRHGMLRVRFLDDGRQQIMAESPWRGPTVRDLRAEPPETLAHRLEELRDELSHRRFDIARGEVFDVSLSLLDDGTTRVHLNLDMIVADALSFRIIANDLAELYDDPDAALPPIGYSYPRYLADRDARREVSDARREVGDASRSYWSRRLAAMPAAPALPLRSAPDRLRRQRVTRRYHRLTPREWDVLAAHARAHGVTLPMAFAAAYCEVLGAWSDDPRFLLNVPLFDREQAHPDVGLLVGDFTNLLIVEVDTGREGSFADAARRLQARVHEDMAHSDYPGLDVLRDLSRLHGGERALAPVVYTSAIGMGELFTREVRECFGEPGWSISQAPQVWLDHQVTEDAGGLLLNWDAVEGLLPDGVLDAAFDAFVGLVRWLSADGADWSEPPPPMIPDGQRARRAAINATAGPERVRVLHEGFFDAAARDGGRVAIVDEAAGDLTYAELARRARCLAGLLVGRGLGAGEPVAITLPKGSSQIEAVLGVLAAGGVFVPVGVDHPAARRERVYGDAGARFVISDRATRQALAWPGGVEVLAIEEARDAQPVPAPLHADGDDLAYVIYTSGSTGVPKGVEMTHRAAMNTVEDLGDRFGVTAGDRGLAVSALDHDWSVYDIFAFLSVGGAIVVIDEAARRDAHRWAGLVRRHGVTVWTSVPALLDMLLVAGEEQGLGRGLRLALVGGDWVGLDLHDRLVAQVPGCRLVALGGATEVGIHSTVFEVTGIEPAWRSVPYGAPLRNQAVRVVDARGRDRPDWVTGELWLGGTGVGRGYRNDPGRTAERFLERDGTRWYRTGDLARYLPDGTLELVGRADAQVKILGHRIELGEVETALRAHPAVGKAVVVAVGGARPVLAAAVVCGPDGPDVAELEAFLSQRLVEYMVPHRIRVVEALPLTANGKVDRGAVERLLDDDEGATERIDPPRGDVERAVASVWSELLDAPEVGRDSNFFVLGGNSLLATRMVTALRRAGFDGANLTGLFSTPTLADFALQLGRGSAAAPAVTVRPDPARRHEPFELTDVQRAYWLGRREEFTLGGIGSHWYWEFDGAGTDVGRLERAWNRVVERHEMLRAVIDEHGRQRILGGVARFTIPLVEGGDDASRALAAMREEMSHHVFDPATWPLFDIRAVRHGGRTRIGVSLDFVVLDALSIMVVFADLAELYADPDRELAPITLSFRDCVTATEPESGERHTAAREYWLARLDDLPSAPQLPLANDPATITRPRMTRREFRLAADRWGELQRRAADRGVTPSAVLAAAFAAVLGRWSSSHALTLNFTVFDRPDVHPDVYRIAGDFTSLVLVANRPEPGETFEAAVRRLQRQMWGDIEHSAFSGISVMRELARRDGASEALMPVVFTSTLGMRSMTGARFDLRMPFGEYVTGLSQTPQVWLDHQVTEHDGGLLLNWDVQEELFADGVLDAMIAAYEDALAWLAGGHETWAQPLPIPLPTAQAAVRRRVNAVTGGQGGALLHEAFFDRARAEHDRTALLWGSRGRLGYGELAGWARRIAGALHRLGTVPGDKVAVTLPKGAGQVAAVLGIAYAGGVYVPVGVEQPAMRRDRMYERAGVRRVVTDEATRAGLGLPAGLVAVTVDGLERAEPLGEPARMSPEDPAYLIYTSGSTGDPKGVLVAHGSASNTVADVNERFGVGPGDRVLAISALDFDLSVYDIFGLLAAGGALVLPREEERRDPERWLALARRHGVTLWNSVPALLEMLLVAAADGGEFPPLRLALVSGDWVGLDLRSRLEARDGRRCRLVALGGATEAAIWSNAFEVSEVADHWSSVPYGFPLRDQCFRVVGEHGEDQPDWVPGELWIGGAGVAIGYHGEPDRTAAQFVTHDRRRWYRTGDTGRYWPDGTLEFLGRTDHQVKVGGHRIELGEIEAALESHPGVSRAVAVAVGEGTKRLAAAVACSEPVTEVALAAHLAQRVPAYMVPQRIDVTDGLPLTANGKIDRRAITASLAGHAPVGGEPPRGEIETRLAELWSELLGGLDVGRHDSFFGVGGDSLLATRLVQAIKQRFGCDIPLRRVLRATTVAEQARLVAAGAVRSEEIEEGVL
jgi:amino acid adenylation domain-containing protein